MNTLRALLPMVVAGSLVASGTPAQTVPLDEGVFRVRMDGRDAGTETFSVRRVGTGRTAQIIASAQIRLTTAQGALNMDALMRATGLDMAPSAYQIEITGSEESNVTVQLQGQRFVANVRSARGDQLKEYRATDATLILDDLVAHQFHFVGARADAGAGPIPVVVPRSGRQMQMTVTRVGTERIEIGGRAVEATHFRLEGGGVARDVWYDDQRRVLRVADPGGGWLAERESLPAS